MSSHTFQAGVTATAQWDCTVVLMFCIWCGNLHGALLAINIWEGYTFKHCLVFACLFFNMGHVFAWGTIYNIHVLVRHKTALVSVLWLLSVTFGAGMASVLLIYSYLLNTKKNTQRTCLVFSFNNRPLLLMYLLQLRV